ncbi:MAG: aldo/keto reductase [Kiritimatiellales bacterium]|nr:aldo/keto reductase [Kiritimatiellales bacterium]
MEYRTLGKTGIDVSPITIGAWQLGGPLFFDGKPDGHPDPGKENVIRMIHELGDLGVNAIDTAEQYSAGESERRVGEALKGRRDQWIVSTKFGFRVGPGNTRVDDSSPETILPSLEGSLKRMGTDFIDIYLYHCAPQVENLDAGRTVLEQAKQQGKIRAYGISTNNTDLIRAMIEHRAVEVVQFASNLLDPATELSALMKEHQLGTQVRGVMAQGRLSGKYFSAAPQFRPDDNRSNRGQVDFKKYAALEPFVPEGCTMAQVALRWVLDRAEHHTVCMGAKTIGDYRAALAALDLPPLSEETSAALVACAEKLQ